MPDPAPSLDPRDLALVQALVRGGTLAEGAHALGQDTSTVFRALKRLEQRLGLTLFERHRQGLLPGELALALAKSAEAIDDELDRAAALLPQGERRLAGSLRAAPALNAVVAADGSGDFTSLQEAISKAPLITDPAAPRWVIFSRKASGVPGPR